MPPWRKKKRKSLSERFWAKVDIRENHECWLWLGPLNNKGYGMFSTNYAHRLAYDLAKGGIPDGLIVRHTCDNPPCVNPAHLLVGTMRDNTRDMHERGRAYIPRGESHPRARLTDNVVLDVRTAQASGETEEAIAELLGIPKSLVNSACRGWKHIQVKS